MHFPGTVILPEKSFSKMVKNSRNKSRVQDESMEEASRKVHLNDTSMNSSNNYISNRVHTTKYTLMTFLPKNLFEQFRRVANIYFLIISVLTALPISPKDPISLIGTFAVVLLVTSVKEAYEDYLRYLSDNELNGRQVSVLKNKEFVSLAWEEVCVGDVVRLPKDAQIPVDCVLLASSDAEFGICYIDTCNLDGETNLKTTVACKQTKHMQKVEEIVQERGYVECEGPNPNLYTFNGSVNFKSLSTPASLTPNQLLLRGCIVRNTQYAIGLAIYTGHESKAMLNANDPPFKSSAVMNTMNKCLYFVFILQGILCIVNTVAAVIWKSTESHKITYMARIFFQSSGELGLGFEIESYLTFVVAYSNLIPISLYVGIEVLKLTQKFLIDNDLDLYHAESDTPTVSRTSNLVEELGQVEYIFSDKTGTLTCNKMEFMCCSIESESYGFGLTADKKVPCSPYSNESFGFKDNRSWELIKNKNSAQQELAERHYQFWMCLALCHTVVPEYDEPLPNDIKGNPQKVNYQATSPDEAALVLAAKRMGLMFHARNPTSAILRNYVTTNATDGVDEKYEILKIIEFDSTRKRMSCVVRMLDGTIRLYCKGADSIIVDRLSKDTPKEFLATTLLHLEQYSEEGLRTLCLAYKDLTCEEFDDWNKRYDQASLLIKNRDVEMNNVAEELECNLQLLGATAIEDKLQDGVPDAIATLIEAGLKVWVLTGDKEETAINIGHSCKLLDATLTLHRLSRFKSAIAMKEYLDERIQEHSNKNLPAGTILNEAIIIDGPALAIALTKEVRLKYLQLAIMCKVCVCCRVSPKQKALVVLLVKQNLPVITLAIGDGANDVSMIQAAHIGVGISGQEGMQAVRSSDYAVAQFRFLEKLLLVHGAWAYQRISKFILYYFYKNMVVVLTEYWFAWSCGFSGQIFFADWLSLAYNAVYTSYPCIAGFALNQVSLIVLYKFINMCIAPLGGVTEKLSTNVRVWANFFSI